MNPLDPLEFQAFCRNLKEEMPIHTETTAKIKRSYSQGMPKNLMEYSAHVDNKFLNDNLAIIEEIAHRDQKHPIPKWFRNYQIKHYAKHGILKADGFFVRDRFFGRMFPREIYYGAGANYHNIGIMSVIGNTKVLGTELSSNSGGSTNGFSANVLQAAKMSSLGVIGAYYDRVAFSVASGAAGNMRLGIYDDSSNPNNLLGDTGSFATANDYAFHSFTEVALTTQQIWGALNTDNGTPIGNIGSTPTNGRVYKLSVTYGALSNPFPSPTAADNSVWQMKTSHS